MQDSSRVSDDDFIYIIYILISGFWSIKILIHFCTKKWPLHRDIRNFLLLTTVKPGIEKVIKVKRERCMLLGFGFIFNQRILQGINYNQGKFTTKNLGFKK